MKTIASFSVDHDLIEPGMYISRIDGDVVTYDLRTRRPNAGNYVEPHDALGRAYPRDAPTQQRAR